MRSSNRKEHLTAGNEGAWGDAQFSRLTDTWIERAVDAAREAWPKVQLPLETFVEHVAKHLPAGSLDPSQKLHTSDLYLACACILRNQNALLAFEQHCVNSLDGVLIRYRANSDLIDEVKQRVREHVLVGDSGVPAIERFSGRGDLRSWVRIIAVREAMNVVRRSRREVFLDEDSLLEALITPGDAGLTHMKSCYVDGFKQAFSAALRSLQLRDQTLLRQHVIDGLSIDELGKLYHIHRATAARSLQRVRRQILVTTRERLGAELQVGPTELDSILRLIRSQLEVTLGWLKPRRR